jgi:Uri superfamily endonuclease
MKGAYMLIIGIKRPVSVQIKSLGEITFGSGLWTYVGSAMGDGSTSLENRLSRHFRKEKTIYWHIDYLLDAQTEIEGAIWTESSRSVECELSQTIAAKDDFVAGPRGFGASDCRKGCVSHIYLYLGEKPLDNRLKIVCRELGLHPHMAKKWQL